jgi:hypothetical protein
VKPVVKVAERVYVGPMPKPWEVAELLSEYEAVVSLSTPTEHSWMGYDPRSVSSHVRFHWLAVPEYNAPPLNEVASALTKVVSWARQGLKVYIHERVIGGRLVTFVASLLIALRGISYVEALAEAARLLGASPDSRAQVQLLRGLAGCLRLGLDLNTLASLDLASSARVEYAATLVFELTPYVDLDGRSVLSTILQRKHVDGVEALAAKVVEAASSKLDYSITWLRVGRREGKLLLGIQVWIPRGMHPRSALRYRVTEVEAVKRSWVEFCSSLKAEGEVELEVVPPLLPPKP